MANCSYKTTLDSGAEWECPCEALPGEERCYWHKKEAGKEPTQEMLEELKAKEIFGVYLEKANLRNANLEKANLQKAELDMTDLRKAMLEEANLQGASLIHTNLQGAWLYKTILQKAHLGTVNLQKAFLGRADLQRARLGFVKLQNADLGGAILQNAELLYVNLKNANLQGSNLQNANLQGSNLQNAKLKDAHLQGTNLYGVKFDSETALEDSKLFEANLYRSYFDETKSFRYVTLFDTKIAKEINEIAGDSLDKKTKVSKKKARLSLRLKPSVLNLRKILEEDPGVAAKILEEGLMRFVREGNEIMFFDRSSQCAIKNPEKGWRHKSSLVEIDGLSDVILKDGEIQPEFIYKGSRADQFEASYEVYNNLYNFYIANGSRDQAGRVHYRRGEAYRKLLREKGGLSWLRSWFFDFLVLWLMAGYGDRIKRPIGFCNNNCSFRRPLLAD